MQLAGVSPDPAAVPPYYAETVGTVITNFLNLHGNQIGDPKKGVDRIFEAVTGEGLAGSLGSEVLRLVLGKDALERMRRNNDKFLHELSLQEESAKSTDFA